MKEWIPWIVGIVFLLLVGWIFWDSRKPGRIEDQQLKAERMKMDQFIAEQDEEFRRQWYSDGVNT